MKEGLPKAPDYEKKVDITALEDIARKVLNEKGQLYFDELVQEDKIGSAQIHLLGAVDSCFERGNITFEEAAEYYKQIGVSPEQASQLRQNKALGQ